MKSVDDYVCCLVNECRQDRSSLASRTNLTSRAGYTMLELVVVVFLIGLFVVVSTPSFRQNVLYNPLKSSARKVIGIINTARNDANKQRKKQIVHLDLDQRKIWRSKDSEDNKIAREQKEQEMYALPDTVGLAAVLTKDGQRKERGQFDLWISGQGYTEETIIHLTDDSGNKVSLHISTFLPGIEVMDGFSYFE